MNIRPKKVSYDDILAKMGLYVQDGNLHRGIAPPTPQPVSKEVHIKTNTPEMFLPKNYTEKIDKHNGPLLPRPNRPTKEQVIAAILKRRQMRRRAQSIKSTKLIMPNDNINVSNPETYDVLFNFSTPRNKINLKGNLNL